MPNGKESLEIYIQICQVWALVLAVVGGLGNLTTILAVIHEIYLNNQAKRKRRFISNQMLSLKGKDLRQSSCENSKSQTALRKFSVCTVNTISSIIQEMSGKPLAGHMIDLPIDFSPGIYRRQYSDPGSSSTSTIQSPSTSLPSTSRQTTKKPSSNFLTVDRCYSAYEGGNRISEHPVRSSSIEMETTFGPIENGVQLTRVQRLTSWDIEQRASTKSQSKVSRRRRKVSLLKCDRGAIIILSLCMTDFIYCAVNLPLTLYTYTFYFRDEEPSDAFCANASYLRYVIAYAEWLTVGFLFLERCINLKKMEKSKLFSPLQTSVALLGIWIFSCLMLLPTYFMNRFGYNKRSFKCDIVSLDRETPSMHKVYFFTFITLIPCLFVLIGCVSIMIQIIRNKNNLIKNGMCPKLIEQRKRETHYSLAIITGLMSMFFISIMPVAINDTMSVVKSLMDKSFMESNDLKDVKISIVCFMIYWIQYAMNFMVYVVANPCFRVAYTNFFRRVKKILRIGLRFKCKLFM